MHACTIAIAWWLDAKRRIYVQETKNILQLARSEFRRMAIVERGAAREHFLSRVEGERERETAKKPFANSSLKLGERRATDKRAIILGTIATEHVAANCRY